ncbi:hypothetical protein PMAC_002078 [Pneumocystis sp. 'macacae']|nr:hypothetical protein PMAC_002078 [Pneumocystis sp. 'macacae']
MKRIAFEILILIEIFLIWIVNANFKIHPSLELKNEDILTDIVDENHPFIPMLETLHLLSRKPSCFRLSVSSLISTCEKLDSDLHENEKLAFAVKLTLCELDTAHVEVPEACRQENLQKCVKELETRPQWWTRYLCMILDLKTDKLSYSGYFRDVTRMCFAARTEVEKDQLLALHRNLTYAQMGLLHNLKLEMDDIDLRTYEKYKMEHSWQQFQEEMEHGMQLMKNEIKEMEKMANVLLSAFLTSINVSLSEVNRRIDLITMNLDKIMSKVDQTSSHAKKEIKNLTIFTNELWGTVGKIALNNFESIKKINNELESIENTFLGSIVDRLNKIRLSLDFSFGSIETLSQQISSMSMVTEALSKTLKNLTFSHNDLFSSLSSIEALQLKIGNGSLSTIKSISSLVNERMDNLLDQIQELKNTTKNAENYIYSWILSKIPFMQDQPLETELSSTFPPPPQHYKLFTDDNLLAFKENRYDAIRDINHPNIPDVGNTNGSILAKFFIPPKIPTEGSYQCFHERWKIPDELPSLTEFGIQQLFDTKNGPLCAQERIAELKKMLKSLLLNFLELLGIMGIVPEQFVEKVEHIRILLLNMHHLINEYRPHQAWM